MANQRSTILKTLGVRAKTYILATVHRPYNADVPDKLRGVLEAFVEIGEPVIFSVHPRTRERIEALKIEGLVLSGVAS